MSCSCSLKLKIQTTDLQTSWQHNPFLACFSLWRILKSTAGQFLQGAGARMSCKQCLILQTLTALTYRNHSDDSKGRGGMEVWGASPPMKHDNCDVTNLPEVPLFKQISRRRHSEKKEGSPHRRMLEENVFLFLWYQFQNEKLKCFR